MQTFGIYFNAPYDRDFEKAHALSQGLVIVARNELTATRRAVLMAINAGLNPAFLTIDIESVYMIKPYARFQRLDRTVNRRQRGGRIWRHVNAYRQHTAYFA